MAAIKLTKNELRAQQVKLQQLVRYLPTLQLKKALLQAEVHETRLELERFSQALDEEKGKIDTYASLFAAKISIDLHSFVKIKEIKKRYENIAGCDVPFFEDVSFQPLNYDLFETPVWVDGAILGLRELSKIHARVLIAEEKKTALERELREVSIRVNLFEKVLIPDCHENIKTIKVFLGDQQLAAVAQAKVAKLKIEQAKNYAY